MISNLNQIGFTSIKAKLLASFSLIIVMLIVTAGIGIYNLSIMNDQMSKIINVSAEKVKLAARVNQGALAVSRAEKNIILADSKAAMDEYADFIAQTRDEMLERRATLRNLVNDNGKRLLDEFAATWDEYIEVNLQIRDLARADLNDKAIVLSKNEGRRLNDLAISQMANLVNAIEQDMANDELEAQARHSSAYSLMLVITLTGLIAGIVIAIFISSRITGALNRLSRRMNDIADGEGDLTVTVDDSSKDETGDVARAFNKFVAKIRTTITSVASETTQVASTSEELSIVSNTTSAAVKKLHDETQQVATAMTQMNATIQDVANSAENAASSASDSNNNAKAGESMVSETVHAVDNLTKEINQSASAIEKLQADSENISTILDVIKGVSEQTNLLALNAAIEAARAGEQGRGFAVVADEVRTLAQRTKESATNIEQMIDKFQSGILTAIEVMTKSQQQTDLVVEKVSKTGETLRTINDYSSAINDMNAQIASAAEQQAVVADEISRNVVNIKQVTEQSSAATEQTSTASNEMAILGNNLLKLVQQFKV
ncbi:MULTISPECIES: methyl-accepting chemotaxis protein [unclassified Pseudoalteromonas]|jgi:methyl-accepting chemotaxis protein|uniref:methyl-accepting chemotaxis protein n=1 Tax=unclassified Pseudoalteromonas TaxID=194690 RepID=UPI00068F1E1A|nr:MULTISPECIES: methyl-accepting chemotaxis protein [unclassified Pseudoalteromonas]MDN3404140.1 methyl-accepting chemotaxis protein [Pseudoalteromonas sp. APC 3218]